METTPTSPAPQSVPPVQFTPTEAPGQYAPQHMPPTRSHGPVIVAVVIGILILAGAVFAYTKLANKSAETPSPTPTASVSASVTPNPTAGWKTYTNTQYGFQLTLTDAWNDYKVFSSSGSQGVGNPKYFEFAMPTSDKTKCVVSITDDVCGYAELMRITVFAKDIWDQMNTAQKNGLNILGQDASIIILGSVAPGTLPSDLKNTNFAISQILSTFTWTNATAGWKTYTSAQYGYSFNYPSNWIIVQGGQNDMTPYATHQLFLRSPETATGVQAKTINPGYSYDLVVSFFSDGTAWAGDAGPNSPTYSGTTTMIGSQIAKDYIKSGQGQNYAAVVERFPKLWELSFETAWDKTKLTEQQRQVLSSFTFTK